MLSSVECYGHFLLVCKPPLTNFRLLLHTLAELLTCLAVRVFLEVCFLYAKLVALQIDNPDRGFSFLRDGPLDMRMGPSAPHSALEIINGWAEDELGRVFREYGEERFWRSIAQRIVEVHAGF